LAEVAAEMNEIFARVGLGQPVPGLRRPAAVSALRPSRGGAPAATLLTAAAAGLVGLGAGAFVVRSPGPPVPAESRLAAQAPTVRPQFQPPASPPVALAQAAPSPHAEAAPVKAPPAAKAPLRPAKAAARDRARFRAKLARLGGAQSRPPIRLSTPVAQPASCEQDADGEDCRRAVVQADRHLRAVYESAFARGVSRHVLVDYRDRWADLRERNTDDPASLIQSYGALAYDLGRESSDDQDPAIHPRGSSGLKALADLLLPWR
jgi:hypothetical protein